MNTSDTTNTPKAGSTCNLVHDRYVFLADGCWGTGIGNCASYGWDPLLYDLTIGDFHFEYDPRATGYIMPPAIYKVIGGRCVSFVAVEI